MGYILCAILGAIFGVLFEPFQGGLFAAILWHILVLIFSSDNIVEKFSDE